MTTEVDTYLKITADIEQAYKTAVGANRAQRKSTKAYRIDKNVFWFGVVGPSILAVLLAPAGIIDSMNWIFALCWGLIAISYLVLFIYPLVSLWLYRHEVRKLASAPFTRQMEVNVKTIMQIDADYLPQLVALPEETLQLGVLELKTERSALEKRTHLVTGALEKIGVFPGLIALLAGLTAVHKTLTELGIETSLWHWAFAVATASIFYFMCGFAQMMLVRYDRIVALTELAILRKKEQPLAD